MKIGNFEIIMKRKKETSGLVAILKTAAFLAVIAGIIAASVFLGTGGSSGEKPKTESYRYININDLADFYYYTPLPGEDFDSEAAAKNQIPEKIMKLDGQKISITGFMMPVRVDENGFVEEFALNGNYDMCFFGAPSSLNQWVHVRMQPGEKARFSHSPTTVSGTLEVGELVENGEVISLYRLTGEKTAGAGRRLF